MNTINFNLDTKDIPAIGETRKFSITGGEYSVFSLEVKNEDGYYYNFNTEAFQSGQTRLKDIIIDKSNVYNGSIVFPKVTDADKYDFHLFADNSRMTKHVDYQEVRNADGSINTNASIGSNSDLLTKTIYQTLKTTLTLSAESPSSLTAWGSVSIGTSTIDSFRNKNAGKHNFKITVTSAATRSIEILRQPTANDISCYVSRTIGSAPVKIDGENEYPTVTNTDTVDGAISSGTKIVMDNNVADNMSVGDKVTGLSDGDGVTVAALNPDGDNVKEFSVSAAVDAGDGATLSFTNQKNYRWPLNNIQGLANGMTVSGTNVTALTKISDYISTTTINSGTENEEVITNLKLSSLDNIGAKPSISRNATTFVETVTQTGNVIFNNQQILLLAGDTIKFYDYGPSGVNNLYGYDIELSDLKVELTEVTTTTTSSVDNSTSIPVAERAGILDDVSMISSIGGSKARAISVADRVHVDSGAGAVSGGGTIVVSSALTLQNGVTLAFANASRIATITGSIKINNTGNTDATLYFDLEKFLKAT